MSVDTQEVQSTETNVDITEYEPANEGALTFDEVESLTMNKTDEQAAKEAKAMTKSSQKAEEAESEAADEALDASENSVKDNSSEEKAQTLEEAEEIKKITGKFKDADIDLPADALFKHKVDGEEVEVSFQELLNNYSGKIPWDKKFQELSQEKKEYMSERKVIEQYITEFANKMQNKDVMGAMEYFAGFAGVKPLEFRKQLQEAMYPKFEQYQQMDETQRKLADTAEENEYYKGLQESEALRREQEQAQQALELEVKRIQEAHKIEDGDLVQIYDELAANYEGEVTPQLIEQYYVERQSFSKAEELVGQVNPDLKNDDVVLENLAARILENPEFTDEDWIEMIKEVYASDTKKSKSKTVSEKIRKNEPKEAQAKQKTQIDELLFSFDEL